MILRRPHWIALAVIGVIALILLNLSDHAAGRLKLAIGSLFLPLFGLASATDQVTGQAVENLLPRRELIKQNEHYRREIERLRALEAQHEQIRRENDRLRELLAWQKQTAWQLKLARVVLRDPANWWRTVQIDLGSRDGVKVDMPVMTTRGLVGRIAEVGFARSTVVLLGDPNCRVSVLVQETRDHGVIVGGAAGPLDTGVVELSYLASNSAVQPGQQVVSSGLGGVFPKGIPVGQILDTRPGELGLTIEARVKLAANLNTLEEVWVLVQ